jgi:raffinose/stachyose/melibiose transport system substrate-binding protein
MALVISATRVYAENPTWDQDRIDGKETFADSKGWQDTLQTIVDLKDAGCFQPGVEGGGFDAITNGITQATSLAAFAPAGAAGDLMRATPDLTLVVEPFPPTDGGKPFVFASANNSLSVNAKGKGKDAAKDFLAWLAEPENSIAFAKISANVPITGIDSAELLPQYEPLKSLLSDGEYSALPNLNWPNPAVYDALGSGVQGLLTGQSDPQAVLAAMDAAWGK